MSKVSQLLHQLASNEVGTREWPGARHNPAVLEYYAEAGHAEVTNDEVPWCAAFVGAVLAKAGLRGTGSLLARSYQKWGEHVDRSAAQPGDIVVLSRGEPWQGHVGFFEKMQGGKVYLVGGNQSNQVQVSSYDAGRIVAVRRASEPRTHVAQSTTLRASTVAKVATAVAPAASVVADADWKVVAILSATAILVLIMLLFIDVERVKKWNEGDR